MTTPALYHVFMIDPCTSVATRVPRLKRIRNDNKNVDIKIIKKSIEVSGAPFTSVFPLRHAPGRLQKKSELNTVKTQIIGRCAMSLELPPLVSSGIFYLFFTYFSRGLSSSVFAAFFTPFLKWVILDCIGHRPII